jgi:hypothetical protein
MARFAIALLALCALGAVSCTGKDPYNPGEPVGQFRVTATLTKSTCGQTPNPWAFDVKLRHEGTSLYWVQGDAPVKGKVDSGARATLETTDTRTLREADLKNQVAACVVSRKDTLQVALMAGTLPATDVVSTNAFTGSLSYHFEPIAGADCSDQLLSTNGDYEALPCDVTYDLSASRTGDLAK